MDCNRPLEGKVILVTRLSHSHCPLSKQLRQWGAKVIQLPLIQTQPVEFTLPYLRDYAWIFFTSAEAVKYFFSKSHFANPLPLIAVIGEGTQEALKSYKENASFRPKVSTVKEAAQEFSQCHPPQRILWPCGQIALPTLKETLELAGFKVDPLVVYETGSVYPSSEAVLSLQQQVIDLVVFTSPSAIHTFIQAGLDSCQSSIACIGPTTAQAAYQSLGRCDIMPTIHNLPALAEAIREGITESRSRRS
jgi:uroporphyrinogen-III synthase